MALDDFSSHATALVYKMNFAASDNSSIIIELITGRRCVQQDVGKTGQPLQCKVNNHCFNIAQKRTEESPVAEHFISCEHTLGDVTIVAIQLLDSHDPTFTRYRKAGGSVP